LIKGLGSGVGALLLLVVMKDVVGELLPISGVLWIRKGCRMWEHLLFAITNVNDTRLRMGTRRRIVIKREA